MITIKSRQEKTFLEKGFIETNVATTGAAQPGGDVTWFWHANEGFYLHQSQYSF